MNGFLKSRSQCVGSVVGLSYQTVSNVDTIATIHFKSLILYCSLKGSCIHITASIVSDQQQVLRYRTIFCTAQYKCWYVRHCTWVKSTTNFKPRPTMSSRTSTWSKCTRLSPSLRTNRNNCEIGTAWYEAMFIPHFLVYYDFWSCPSDFHLPHYLATGRLRAHTLYQLELHCAHVQRLYNVH